MSNLKFITQPHTPLENDYTIGGSIYIIYTYPTYLGWGLESTQFYIMNPYFTYVKFQSKNCTFLQ